MHNIVHSKLDYCNYLFYSINASQMKPLQTIQNALARTVTKTPKHHHITPACPKITSLAKSPSMHPLQNSISHLQCPSNLSTLLHSPTSHHPTASSSSYLSLSRPPISSSLKFCNHSFAYPAPALCNGLPKDLHQFAHPPNPPLNFTYSLLALSTYACILTESL